MAAGAGRKHWKSGAKRAAAYAVALCPAALPVRFLTETKAGQGLPSLLECIQTPPGRTWAGWPPPWEKKTFF
jgi:hypothetical protein